MVAEGGGQVREQVSPQVNNKPVIDFTRVLFQFLKSKLKKLVLTKFRWKIDSPLEITVSAKQTKWPEVKPQKKPSQIPRS